MSSSKGRFRVNRRAIALASAASLIGAGAAVALVTPAQAQLTTFCSGSAGAVTVPGDLVVAQGDSCELSGTIVEGDTVVRPDADLILLEGAELRGEVSVRNNAFIATDSSTVEGQLNLRQAFGGYTIESNLNDAVDSRNGSYFFSLDSNHQGTVLSRSGEVYLESGTVNADFDSRNDIYSDVYDSTITGEAFFANVQEGSLFCFSEVDGNATFRGSPGDLQIGAQAPMYDCGFNYFGSNLRINNNSGDIQLSDNIVRRNLVCNNNTNAPVGEGNRVRGEARGQCAEIAPAAEEPSLNTFRGNQDRAAAVESKLEARRDAAQKTVDEVGPANIGS